MWLYWLISMYSTPYVLLIVTVVMLVGGWDHWRHFITRMTEISFRKKLVFRLPREKKILKKFTDDRNAMQKLT